MPKDIRLWRNGGSSSFERFAVSSSTLAVISVGNINPNAIIQLEYLGACFPVTGEKAERVKDLLERCRSIRLGRLGVFVGWRKNDPASLMARSAGGQAVALLSMCLTSMYNLQDSSMIISELCSKLCPKAMNSTSVSQLGKVAKLMAAKLNCLGFGNILASEVLRLHEVYRNFGQPMNSKLMEILNADFVVDLFEMISLGLRQEGKICRISGFRGMGNVLGLVKTLFSSDILLTVEGVVIHNVRKPKIHCEIAFTAANSPTLVRIDDLVSTSVQSRARWPIHSDSHRPSKQVHVFNWSGWVADSLWLDCANLGFIYCPQLMEACCAVIALLPSCIWINSTPMVQLLGPSPRARIDMTCERVMRVKHPKIPQSRAHALKLLITAVKDIAHDSRYKCSCRGSNAKVCGPGPLMDFENFPLDDGICQIKSLWFCVGKALTRGFKSLFVDAGPITSVCPETLSDEGRRFDDLIIQSILSDSKRYAMRSRDFVNGILSLVRNVPVVSNALVWGSDFCIIYPTVITDFRIPSQQEVLFMLQDGQLIYHDRYHDRLKAYDQCSREWAYNESQEMTKELKPDSLGAHSAEPQIVIEELFECLELRLSAQYMRKQIHLNLADIVYGYVGLRYSDECRHRVKDKFKIKDFIAANLRTTSEGQLRQGWRHQTQSQSNMPQAAENMRSYISRARPTSVAKPCAYKCLGVAMTSENAVAQFLCCSARWQSVLRGRSCLNCTAGLLMQIDPSQKMDWVIIVS